MVKQRRNLVAPNSSLSQSQPQPQSQPQLKTIQGFTWSETLNVGVCFLKLNSVNNSV